MGLKLEKIHQVLLFDQSPWLKEYNGLNMEMRMEDTNDIEKNFYKLMYNVVFGKIMANKRNQVHLCVWGLNCYQDYPEQGSLNCGM